MAKPYLTPWSRDYVMVGNTTVRNWDDEEAIMDESLYDFISSRIGEPVVGFVNGIHYHFKRSNQILSQECAVPNSSGRSDPTLLVQW